VIFGVIVLGTMWQKETVFGRFSRQRLPSRITPSWNTSCRFALAKVHQSRTTPGHSTARKTLKANILKAKSSYWRQFVQKGQTRVQASSGHCPKIHKFVKSGIRPKRCSTSIVKVDGQIWADKQMQTLWPAYLQAEVSWEGPRPVANIWKQMQSPESPAQDPNPHFDAQAASRAASETRAFQRTSCHPPPAICELLSL
jgi:hypothetical protein